MCPQKTNLCKKRLSWNQEQTSRPSIVVDRDWRGLKSLLLVMRAKREWHKDFTIKCCTTSKRSEICWFLFFLTQNNNSFPFHVLTFTSHILFLLLSLLLILLYLLYLCITTCWLQIFLTQNKTPILIIFSPMTFAFFSVRKLSLNPPFYFLLLKSTTTHLTWQTIDTPKSSSLVEGRHEFHLHFTGF